MVAKLALRLPHSSNQQPFPAARQTDTITSSTLPFFNACARR